MSDDDSSSTRQRLTEALADSYRVEREHGAGGMATVFLAYDLKHHRQVAIKVLHPDLTIGWGSDRFLAEIRTTANLQHPHILPLYDSGAVAGLLYYVMPFIDGETLRSRLQRETQLPVADAIRIIRDVADALAYAHAKGVIHRDIKPENILLNGGHAFVADFGIALAVQSASDQRLTKTGISVGTPQYMSPEQAMGDRTIDARTDIYSLGCVAYEMFTGEPPFGGPTAQATIRRLLHEDPRPVVQLRPSIAEHINDAIFRALEKLPADRWNTVGEFASALHADDLVTSGNRRSVRARSHRRERWFTGAALVATAAASFIGGAAILGRPTPVTRFGRAQQVSAEPGLEVLPSISPDGKSVAYAAGSSARPRIFVRPVSGGRAIVLTSDSLRLQTNPTWSPDGTRILFVGDGAVYSVPSVGGIARQELPRMPGGDVVWAAWAPDAHALAFVVADSLFVKRESGVPQRLATMRSPSLCSWSRDAERIACATDNPYYASVGTLFGNISSGRIVICSVRDGRITNVSDSVGLNHSPVWSSDGRRLMYVSDRDGMRDIYVQDLTRGGAAAGAAQRITIGLNAHSISVSADDRHLAYSVLQASANVWSLPIPATGPVTAVDATQLTFGNQVVEGVWASRDGRWLVYDSNARGNSDIFRIRLPAGEPEQLTFDASNEYGAQLSPNARDIVFHSLRTGSRDIYVQPLDGGPTQTVAHSQGHEMRATWSPDGATVLYTRLSSLQRPAIWSVKRNADGAWGAPVERLTDGFAPAWSPDGSVFAFTTPPFSGGNLRIAAAASGPAVTRVDTTANAPLSAESVVWSYDGSALYFKHHDVTGRAEIWSTPAAGGRPHKLVRFDDLGRPSVRLDLAANKERLFFVMQERQSDVWVIDVLQRK